MKNASSKHLSTEQIEDLEQLADAKSIKDLTRFQKVSLTTLVSAQDVKNARKGTGLSQSRFAETLGLSPKTIQSWEQGWRIPDPLASKIIRLILKDPAYAIQLKVA